jgi:hypothetical protein
MVINITDNKKTAKINQRFKKTNWLMIAILTCKTKVKKKFE